MKNLWKTIDRKILILSISIVAVWRIYLLMIEALGKLLLTGRETFFGPIPWANFDGIHYLLIAERGYGLHQQAFFPLFPALIRSLAPVFGGDYLTSSLFLVHSTLIVALILLWKLVEIDFGKEVSRWSLAFLLLFPTAFFLGSVYTESFFLMLVLGSFYAARKGRWRIAGFLGALASATKMVGIFLLPALFLEFFIQRIKGKELKNGVLNELKRGVGILLTPLGLLSYMIYLNITTGDAFAFIHSQPAFGANRSGSEIILLPQVIFRYAKIFLTVPLTNYDYWIALVEAFSFSAAIFILVFDIQKTRLSYLVFSLLSILTPTLTGTLSSMPRYILAAFPIFIFLSSIPNNSIKFLLLAVSNIFLILLAILFTRGYFVA